MPDANENGEELFHQLLELVVDGRMQKSAADTVT
jgi:hypothetical protein